MSTGLMLEIIFFCYMMCNFGSKKSQNFKVLIFNIILIKIIGTDIYSVYNMCKALFQALCVCVCVSCSVVSHSLWPHRLKPTRLFCPWNSPGKNTGVGSHSLLHGSNLGLLHCRWILYCLSHQGSPLSTLLEILYLVLITTPWRTG